MSPHRLDPVLRGPLSLLASIDSPGWACSAVGACVAFIVGGDANVALILLAITAAGLDVSSGTLRAVLSPTEHATARTWFAGGVAKLLRGHVIALGIVLDWTLMLGVPGVADVVEAYRPWTRFALLVLIGAEGTSAIRNVRLVLAIPRPLEQAFNALQQGTPGEALRPVEELRRGAVSAGANPD